MDIKDNLNRTINATIAALSAFDIYAVIPILSIDCSKLEDIGYPWHADAYVQTNVFNVLHSTEPTEKDINHYPCLYVFELADSSQPEAFWSAFTSYQQDNAEKKRLPAFYKSKFKDSNTIYVGKVNNNIGGRLVNHLGYAEKPEYHCLHLRKWAKDFVFNIHVIRFREELRDMMPYFESRLAKALRPLIGKNNY